MGIANITNNILTDSGAVIGAANGVATLDSGGKIPVSQLPNSVMEFKGTWSAATNNPTLANGTGNAGDVYEVSAAGTVNFGAGGIAFALGDYVVYDGATWQYSSGQKGTVTSLTFSAPLSGGTITTSGTVSIPAATSSVDGYLSATDWTTFNGKQNALTNPVTGTGTANYLPKFTGASTLGNSIIQEVSSKISITSGALGWIYSNDTNHSIILRGDRNATAGNYTNYHQYGGTIAEGLGHKFWTGGNLADQVLRFQIGDNGVYVANNLLVGTTTDSGYKLDVNGSTRITGLLTGSSGIKISGGSPYSGAYTSDGLWGATATPNFIATSGNGGSYGTAALLLGYFDNESGLYSPAYGFQVKSTDGAGNLNRVVRSIVIKDVDKNTQPFIVYNNGAIYTSATIQADVSISSADYRFNDSGYITYNVGNVSTRTFTIRNYGTTVLGFSSSNAATFSSSVTGSNFYAPSNTGFWSDAYDVRRNGFTADGTNLIIRAGTSGTGEQTRVAIVQANGNVLINTTTDSGFKLDVNGTSRFSGAATVSLSAGAAAFGNGINIVTAPGTYTAGHGGILQFQNEDVITAGIRGVRDPGSWASSMLFYTHTGTAGNTFGTTFTEKMRITDVGDLAIGTSTVSWAASNRRVVEINGASQVLLGIKVGDVQKGYHYHNGTNLYTENSHSGGDWYLAQVGAGNMYLNTNGVSRISIASSGNVGVGVTTPGAILHVKGQLESNYGLILEGTYGTGHAYGWRTNGGNSDVLSLFSVTLSSRLAVFGYSEALIATGGTTRLYITGGGNVLIGTTTDNGSKFQVNGTSSFLGTVALHDNLLRVRAMSDPNHAIVYNSTINGPLSYGYYGSGLGYTAGGSANIVLMTYSDQVLIGYTTPQGYKLAVNGAARFASMVYGGGGVRISGGVPNTSYTPDGLWGASATPNFIDSTGHGGSSGNSLNASGLLLGYADNGSGLYSPAYGFQVKSTDGAGATNRVVRAISIKDTDRNAVVLTIYNTGTMETSGSITATSFFESSDKTIKTLIQDNYQTKEIESVTAKLYIKNGKEELGYYAQDLQEILPSAVSKGEDGLLSLSYREVHTAKIARLEKRVLELEQQLNLK